MANTSRKPALDAAEIARRSAGPGDHHGPDRDQGQGRRVAVPDLAGIAARHLPLLRQDDRQLRGAEQVGVDRRGGRQHRADGEQREAEAAHERSAAAASA